MKIIEKIIAETPLDLPLKQGEKEGFALKAFIKLSLRRIYCACLGNRGLSFIKLSLRGVQRRGNLGLSFVKLSLRGVQRRGNLGLMIMLLLLCDNQVLAQTTTCAAPPSCSALGFDKGAGDCSGQAILRCPFDQSKVFCAGVASGSGGETCKGICARVNGTMYRLSDAINKKPKFNWEDQSQECAKLTTDGKHWFPVPSIDVAKAFAGKLSGSPFATTWINIKIDEQYAYIMSDGEVRTMDSSLYLTTSYCVTTY